ncbi:MAG: transglycosylase domain-containing protein [Candidatus Wildermuthbacteria bacterium]|nr:transglycosylase domain-containing protein [Candidatus Wildermuthbacteria bacterium]
MKKNRRNKRVLLALKIVFLSFLGGAAALALLFLYYAKDLPRPELFGELQLIQPTRIYDRAGEVLLYEIYGEEKRELVSLRDVPRHAQDAVVAIEDANFYKHFGVDFRGVARSFLVNLRLRAPAQGGSTISQQLIRSSLLTKKKTLERKAQEIILAIELERRYSKEQILEFYLNQIPFGSNAYGIGAASRVFFNKAPAELSLAESALLAATIKAPSYYSPHGAHTEELTARKNYILQRMEQLGFITATERDVAKEQALVFADPSQSIKAPHFALHVTDLLLAEYGEEFLRENGLRVYTSLDWDLQQAAEKAVATYALSNKALNAHNAALVALDPRTGEILAMVGSKDWWAPASYPEGCKPGVSCVFDPKVNVATRIPGRQPGSAFKPFAYVTAFQKGHDDKTETIDELTNFGVWGGKEYIPQNYDGKFRGTVTLRQGLAQSLNIPSIKVLLDFAGLRDSIRTAREFGLATIQDDTSLYGPALVLGGGEVRLLDLVSAYGVFATEGMRVPALSIAKILDAEGNVLRENRNDAVRIMGAAPIRIVNSILSDNEARAPIFGSNSVIYFPGRQVAVKTGTTQDFRDGWIVGYTPSTGPGQAIVAGVWVGNNDNSPMDKEPGIVLAGPIWRNFMEHALSKF